MLESIRSGAQSWGVKIAFGVIILVFVFWGVGNFNDRDYSNVVAVVNGEPILALEFEKAYQSAEEYILRNNPSMTRAQLARDHLGRQVLRDLIQQTLVEQEGRRVGMATTPREMRLYVEQIPAFHNESGKFDPEAYKRVLAAQRVSAAQFEKDLADQLLRDKMLKLVTASVWVDEDEALNRYNYLRESRFVDYIFIPAKNFGKNINVPAEDVDRWYETHKKDYEIPAMVEMEFIDVRPEALVNPDKLDPAAVRAWYDANKSRFENREEVNVSHILVPLPEDAAPEQEQEARKKMDQIQKDLAAGKSFASVADEYNQENAAGKGGVVGWIGRGETVPAFEEAAFSIMPGKVSEVVRTPFGLHVLLVNEKREAGTRPFEQVEAEARKGLAAEEGADQLHDALDNLIEDNILQKPLADSAAKYGLKVENSGLLSKSAMMEKYGISSSDADMVFATPPSAPLDVALSARDHYLVARVVKSDPASIKPLDQVRQEIVDELKKQGAIMAAMEDAAKLLKKVERQSLAQIRAEHVGMKTDIKVERGGRLADFLPDPSLMEDIFAAKPGSWLPEAHAVASPDGDGALIARIDKILPPPADEFASVQQILNNAVKQDRMDAIYALFISRLADGADIKITNQDLVDRVNM